MFSTLKVKGTKLTKKTITITLFWICENTAPRTAGVP